MPDSSKIDVSDERIVFLNSILEYIQNIEHKVTTTLSGVGLKIVYKCEEVFKELQCQLVEKFGPTVNLFVKKSNNNKTKGIKFSLKDRIVVIDISDIEQVRDFAKKTKIDIFRSNFLKLLHDFAHCYFMVNLLKNEPSYKLGLLKSRIEEYITAIRLERLESLRNAMMQNLEEQERSI